MTKEAITFLAKAHENVVSAVFQNFEAIATRLIEKRGSWANAEDTLILHTLAELPDVDPEIRKIAGGSADFCSKALSGKTPMSPEDLRIISAVEGAMYQTKDLDGRIAVLKKLSTIAKTEALTAILDLSAEILVQGRDTIYSADGIKKLLGPAFAGTKTIETQASIGGAAAEDVAGAVIGGTAGAVGGAIATWWAGSGPGAVAGGLGGGASGAIVFSGKYAWEAAKKWWDGTYHGETDPVGPIGGEIPGPERE